MSISEDTILFPPGLEAELAIPIDVAADEACTTLGLPLLGGPSGRGWSYASTAQTCPYLFFHTYEKAGADGREKTKPAEALQIGGFFHLLTALYYAYGLDGEGNAFIRNRGLLAPHLVERLGKRGRKTPKDWAKIPADASDRLLAFLKGRADIGDAARAAVGAVGAAEGASLVPSPRPSLSIILEAERIFDAHTTFYGSGQEDVTPLAVEWPAEHPKLGYTCRYDSIVQLGPNDPFVRSGQVAAGAVVVHEHKSAKWLSDWAQESWFLDGEVLGQALLWEPSGCVDLFGPLAGIIVDIVTKEKTPKFLRVLVPPAPAALTAFEKTIRWQNGEIALWRGAGYYPRRLTSCWRFGRPCGLYNRCRSAAASEALGLEETP